MELSLDEMVDLLFNSFNNELKAVIIGFLVDETPRTAANVLERGRELTKDPITFKPRTTSVIQNYFDGERQGNLDFFVDRGIGRRGQPTVSYALNAFGREYGAPVARFLLYQSDVRFNLPLQSWLGLSQQNGPAEIAHLLAYIDENPAATTMDIVRASRVTKTAVLAKLKKMAEAGLIYRRSFAQEENGQTYTLRPQQDGSIQGGSYKYSNVYRAICRAMHRYRKPFSAQDIRSSPGFPYSDMDKIKETLGDMVRKGKVNDGTPWRAGERMSEFRTTARGHDLARWIINPIIGFVDHESESVELVSKKEIYQRKLPIAMQLYRSQIR